MSDPRELQRILGATSAPRAATREDRVRLLGEFADAVLVGRDSREAALFVAGGISSWLTEGGNLRRDYWRTAAGKGSNATESVIWRKALLEALREARRAEDSARTLTATSPRKIRP